MKDNLTAKEIFQKVVNFESCSRTLKWEMGYLSLTIPRWYKEGLPRKDNSKPIPETMMIAAEAHGLPSHGIGTFRDRERNDVSIYFNLDEGLMGVPVSFWYNPPFEKIIFYEDDNYIEYQDRFGIRKREYKDLSSMPQWLEFPVKNRSDWEKIKEEKLQFNSIKNRFYPKIDMDNYV